MPDTPLNPDALEAAANELWDKNIDHEGLSIEYDEAARIVVSTYLAAALPEVTTVEEVARLWRQVSEAIDHEHLDPREFVDLGGLKFLLGQILDSFRPEVKP